MLRMPLFWHIVKKPAFGRIYEDMKPSFLLFPFLNHLLYLFILPSNGFFHTSQHLVLASDQPFLVVSPAHVIVEHAHCLRATLLPIPECRTE